MLIAVVAISLILVAGSQRAARLAEYQATLSRLSDEVVQINNPLAEIFARGLPPDPEMVGRTREDLAKIKAELEALGPPPAELAEAHAALTESVRQFGQAYDQPGGKSGNRDGLAFRCRLSDLGYPWGRRDSPCRPSALSNVDP